MTIHTVPSLRKSRRRVETRLQQADSVLAQMQDGCALHLEYAQQGPRWSLSNGRQVSVGVAKLVITSASVVAVGDALFDGVLAQTFRWWSNEENQQ